MLLANDKNENKMQDMQVFTIPLVVSKLICELCVSGINFLILFQFQAGEHVDVPLHEESDAEIIHELLNAAESHQNTSIPSCKYETSVKQRLMNMKIRKLVRYLKLSI